jgi:hypothetical protein
MNRSNEGENPDILDRLLSNLPKEPVPADLAVRIYASVVAHHRRHIALHIGASILLTVIGIWLALPGFADMVQNLVLPDNGWIVVSALMDLAGAGAARMSADLISAITAFQVNLSDPFNGVALVGIIALAAGCLIALEQMLPRSEA